MPADTFMPEKPCRNGHLAPRYANGERRCTQCVSEKEARKYIKYSDKLKEKASRWYEENNARGRATRNAYHARMKDDPEYQAMRAAYNEQHRDRFLEMQRAKNSTPEARAAKAAQKREQRALYTAYEHKRRAAAVQAVPAWHGEFDLFVAEEALKLCAVRRAATGVDWHVDHMIPLLAKRACGLHCAANFQVIPERLNRRKNNKLWLTEPLEWLRHI